MFHRVLHYLSRVKIKVYAKIMSQKVPKQLPPIRESRSESEEGKSSDIQESADTSKKTQRQAAIRSKEKTTKLFKGEQKKEEEEEEDEESFIAPEGFVDDPTILSSEVSISDEDSSFEDTQSYLQNSFETDSVWTSREKSQQENDASTVHLKDELNSLEGAYFSLLGDIRQNDIPMWKSIPRARAEEFFEVIGEGRQEFPIDKYGLQHKEHVIFLGAMEGRSYVKMWLNGSFDEPIVRDTIRKEFFKVYEVYREGPVLNR